MNENESTLDLLSIHKSYEYSVPYQKIGKVHASRGTLYEVSISKAIIGSNVEFVTEYNDRCLGEVVAIEGNKCLVSPYEDITGINSETRVYLKDLVTKISVTENMLGRVIDFQGNPIDGKGPIEGPFHSKNIFGKSINPLDRRPINEPLDSGINSINCFATLGKGQRISILAGSGVGKSVMLGMIAQHTNADINVIALIGERGREVIDFIESDLGEEGLKNSVVVVATSDESPLIKIKAAYVATTIAEYFRDKKNDVLLMMDSLTRFAMANREISLSVGEPPGQRGYTPSVFAKLPKLLERAGAIKNSGTITGIYTVLVEGGDMDEPVTDAVRAIVDGHIQLSRELASKNFFPAVDILPSLSRVMDKVATREHKIVASHLRDLLSSYRESEDLINVGAYVQGTNSKVDKAIVIIDDLNSLMRQDMGMSNAFGISELYDKMVDIARKAEQEINPELLQNNSESE